MLENKKNDFMKVLASEFKSSFDFKSSAQLVNWLKEKHAKSQDKDERTLIKRLIEEQVQFGEADDWGTYSPELVLYERLLQYIRE